MNLIYGKTLSIWLSAAIAGALLALYEAPARRRAAEEKEKAEEYAALKRPARRLFELVRGSDEVLIRYGVREKEKVIHIEDRSWISEFSSVLLAGTYRPVADGFWISDPEIQFYREHRLVLSLMLSGSVLRGYGPEFSGAFVVEEQMSSAAKRLIL